jgi:hypothetical protein
MVPWTSDFTIGITRQLKLRYNYELLTRYRYTIPQSTYCTPYRDRTCDLLYVKQPLLPSELKVHSKLVFVLINKGCLVLQFFV